MPKALIIQGGLQLHKPREVAEIFATELRRHDFEVRIEGDFSPLVDDELMSNQDLIVINYHLGDLNWRLGCIGPLEVEGLTRAVRQGSGLAGIHAGMGDAFRNEVEFQFMIGGQWVAHPGDDGVTYDVTIVDRGSPITNGIEDFRVVSEKYFMHMDPGVTVLAVTDFDGVQMPVAWTKSYGKGRVFYCSLGHSPGVVMISPVLRLVVQGFVWAAREPGTQ